MATDRRVDAARSIEFIRVDHLRVQFFAHAVKSLEFVIAPRTGVMQYARERVRIVGCELRIQLFTGGKRSTRTREVRDVGILLARENRE